MQKLSFLGEMKRLHAFGFGVHHIRPNSKAPVKKNWAGDNRDTIQTLTKEYQKGYNIGTKLGKPSSIEYDLQDGLYMKTGFLAVIDVDVKGKDKKHQKSAEAWVNENLPGLLEKCPITLSGRGSGSKHIWILVDRPIDSRKLYSCNEMVEVHMPSTQPSKRDVEALGKEKTDQGFRLRAAWEVDFMCAGRQVVLPPSIHPDSGKEYKWQRPINSPDDIPFVDIDELLQDVEFTKRVGAPKNRSKIAEFEIVDPDEFELEMRLKPELVDAIYEGSGVSDRSAMCLSIALSMVGAKFSDAEILGVLTNREYFIGDVAYEHSQSTHRQRAARWAFDYCVNKARHEADVVHHFDSEVEVYATLSPEKSKQQQKELIADAKELDWRKRLDRTDADALKPTYKNIVRIFENAVDKKLVRIDLFGMLQTYGVNTPWGGVEGRRITDQDYLSAKMWLTDNWKIQPNINLIKEAFDTIAGINRYHSVRDHLDNLPEWDGEPRLATWMKRTLGAKAPEPYLSEVSKKFIVAAIARIYDPGCKVDNVVIFEGTQGIGKSTIGRVLATDRWFLDQLPDLHDKDSSLVIQGNWFIEMGELSTLKRSDVDVVKAYITRTTDKFRPPYGKNVEEFARQCLFFGTTNSDAYLKDKTGNRRFLPVKLTDIDLDALKEERDQLFAEGLFLYEMGEKVYMEKGTEAEIQSQTVQNGRVAEDDGDVMFTLIKDWSDKIKKTHEKMRSEGKKVPKLKFKIEDLFGDFMNAEYGETVKPPLVEFAKNPYKYQMAAIALKRAGFENYESGGRRKWRFQTVEQ